LTKLHISYLNLILDNTFVLLSSFFVLI